MLEWEPTAHDWRLLPPGSTIEDPCLVRPLSTNALRGIRTSDEVLEGWVSQGHPVVRREIERARADGLREIIADLCEAYGVELTEGRRTRLQELETPALEAMRAQLKQKRSWPEP